MAADIEFDNLEAKLNEWADKLAGPHRNTLEKLKPPIVLNIRGNFNSSATAGGVNWPPRKVQGDGHPLLMDTGLLMQASVGSGPGHISEITDTQLDFGVSRDRIPYARVHQYGFRDRNIPKREYMAISHKTVDTLAQVAADELLNVFLD